MVSVVEDPVTWYHMPDAVEAYLRGLGPTVAPFLPNWTPETPRQLGDVGTFDAGAFVRRTTLEELGIAVDGHAAPATRDHTTRSPRGVTVTVSPPGASPDGVRAIGRDEAGARLAFSRPGAFVVAAPTCRERRLANADRVKAELLDRLRARELAWDPGDALVTGLVEAASATVVVAETAGSAVELRATDDVGDGWGRLGDLGAAVETAATEGRVVAVVAGEATVPLFEPRTLSPAYRRWLADRRSATGGGPAGPSVDPLVPVDVEAALEPA